MLTQFPCCRQMACLLTPILLAISQFASPFAANRMIWARLTNPCGREWERTIDVNCSRSRSERTTGALGRPVLMGPSLDKLRMNPR